MAGEYIEFNNNTQPALNDVNVNRLQQLIKQDIQGAVSGDTLPIGAIIPFGSNTIPENWLLCDGSAVSRTQYRDLFNIIGITFGQGDGFETFNLPDLRDKVPVGKDSNDTDFNLLGNTGGEKTHTLTIQEMPSHFHYSNDDAAGLFEGWGSKSGSGWVSASHQNTNGGNWFTANTGGSQPHNILQPYIVTNYIIKAYQTAGIVSNVIDNLNSTSSTDALSANQGNALKQFIQGTTLYSYNNGTAGNVTLSQDVSNMKRLRIVGYVVINDIKYNFLQEVNVVFDGKVGILFKGHLSSTYNYIVGEPIELSSTTITRGTQELIGFDNTGGTFRTSISIYITKVIGFDY